MTTTIPTFEVGQTCTYEQVIDDKLVRDFADLSGDHNAIHVDDAVAKTSRFGQRIAHGAILFGLISKALGMDMPGVGTVYLAQTCNFKLPVFIGDTLRATTEIVELKESKSRPNAGIVTFKHEMLNQRGEIVCQCLRMALVKRKTV